MKPQSASIRNVFPSLRKALKLLVPDDAPQPNSSPTDISQLYKGYAPLSMRLVEHALQGGWTQLAEALSYIPGAQFDNLQVCGMGHMCCLEAQLRVINIYSAARDTDGWADATC